MGPIPRKQATASSRFLALQISESHPEAKSPEGFGSASGEQAEAVSKRTATLGRRRREKVCRLRLHRRYSGTGDTFG